MRTILFILLSVISVFGSENSEGVLSFHMENDLVVGTDYDYTNGFLVQRISGNIESWDLPKWATKVRDSIPLFDREGYKNNVGYGFGQEMYTPKEIEDPDLREDDRPYAGWTYLTLSLHHKDVRKLNKLELKLGFIGERSLAEDTQKLVHELTDSSEPMGWEHQLKDEFGVILSYEHRRKLFSDHWYDVIPNVKVSVGNVATFVSVGMTVRCGYNVPNDFHSNRISSSGYALPRGPKPRSSLSVYVFTTVSGYAVARDVFLDGNTFQDSHSVDKKWLRGELEVGGGISYKKFFLTYTRVFKTKEYDTQDSGPTYGSVNVGFRF
jgi:hypothetical protein